MNGKADSTNKTSPHVYWTLTITFPMLRQFKGRWCHYYLVLTTYYSVVISVAGNMYCSYFSRTVKDNLRCFIEKAFLLSTKLHNLMVIVVLWLYDYIFYSIQFVPMLQGTKGTTCYCHCTLLNMIISGTFFFAKILIPHQQQFSNSGTL